MSSATDPVAPFIGSKQRYDALLNGPTSSVGTTTRKRKLDESDLERPPELGEPFTIEAASAGHSIRPFRLVPNLLTSRSCLPLSYLDLNGIGDQSANTRIFTSRNAFLEANLYGDTFDQPLLIATSGANDERLFAIERFDTELYALCRLGQWVNLKALQKLHSLSQIRPPLSKQPCTQHINRGESEWRRSFAVGSVSDFQNSHRKKVGGPSGRAVRLCMSVPQQPAFVPPTSIIQQAADDSASKDLELKAGAVAKEIEDLQSALPDPAEALATIRAQYQEALYLSRSSLAYFAKGPLSRARAAFSSSNSPNENTLTLVQYLRSSILTLAVMDQKYKDALPSVIDALPAGNVSEDDTEAVIANIQKKIRKSKKDKISKDGLYHGEETNIARWWLNRYGENLEHGFSSNREDALKELLLKQRARETQLQIILVLETLALEASGPHHDKDVEQLDVPVDGAADTQAKKKKRVKKPQDLNTQLDLLIDRLSIWQSMRLEEAKDSAPDSRTNVTQGLSADETADADHLKSFCVDIVLPFYGGRLPEKTAMLCQKLGGPKVQSPTRPPLSKAMSSSRLTEKTGAATAQLPTNKPRRTLERVLTEEKISRSRPPSLSRSATDSALPGLKREVSDTSLSTIPLNRVALQKSQRYSQREVDLKIVNQVAEAKLKKKAKIEVDLKIVNQAAEAKLKKKAKIEQELQGAIAALKKPNPRMAVKELVEAAERRAIGSSSRKSKNPVRNLFAQGVQVTATPKGNRRKDVFGGLPPLPAPTVAAAVEPEEIPPSSTFKVPNSVQKHSVDRTEHMEPRLPMPYNQPNIEQTPTRGPSKRSKSLLSIPHGNKPSSVLVTPSKPRRSIYPMPQPLRSTNTSHSIRETHILTFSEQAIPDSDIHETPQKPQIAPPSLDLTQLPLGSSPPEIGLNMQGNGRIPNIPSSLPVMEEESSKSIYETLGWDDYVDELS